jgi:hypothetical protein
MKNAIKIIVRHIKSYIAYLNISREVYRNKKNIDKLFNMNFREIHIVCPGPSAVKILDCEFEDSSAVIFVNHAVKMASDISNDNLFYFSADGVRTSEVIKISHNELKKCTSILAPWHLFHVNNKILRSIDIVLKPKVHVRYKYGLETVDNGPEQFSVMTTAPCGSGFGSLVYALKFGLIFTPNTIKLWGCDFGNKNGKKYFDKNTPARSDTPFDLIREHFSVASEKIKEMGVEVYLIE